MKIFFPCPDVTGPHLHLSRCKWLPHLHLDKERRWGRRCHCMLCDVINLSPIFIRGNLLFLHEVYVTANWVQQLLAFQFRTWFFHWDRLPAPLADSVWKFSSVFYQSSKGSSRRLSEKTLLWHPLSQMLPSPARKDLAWWCYEIQTLASAESLQITTRLHLNWPSSASRWLLAHPLKALSGQPVNDSLWGTLLLVLNQGHSLIREMSQASGLGSFCQLLY